MKLDAHRHSNGRNIRRSTLTAMFFLTTTLVAVFIVGPTILHRAWSDLSPDRFFTSYSISAQSTNNEDRISNTSPRHRQLFLPFLSSFFQRRVSTPHLATINQVNQPGFGDLANQYSFSMASFNGYVFVGTLNSPLFRINTPLFVLGLANFGPLNLYPSFGSKVYRGSRNAADGSWSFDIVHDFINHNPDNYGSRKMLVVKDYLYLATANHAGGLEVWQTTGNGDVWQQVTNAPGFGDKNNISGRGMAVCGGYLYVGAENRDSGAQIWRHALLTDDTGALDTAQGWEEVGADNRGFGDGFNYFVSEFVVYKGFLYGSTLNGLNGGQVWRTAQCDSANPANIDFDLVVGGGFGNRLNSGILTMKNVKQDTALLLGTTNYLQGTSLYTDDGTGTDFRAVYTWGNGNLFNSYTWAIEEFQGRVFIGTYNILSSILPWSLFQLFSLDVDETSAQVQDLISEDRLGLSSFGQYGIRNMIAFDDNTLMVGTAGHFLTSGTLVFEANGRP